MNNTAWKYSVQYINTLPDDTLFATKDMLKYVRKTKPNVSSNTLFWHRVIMCRLGFLEQIKPARWFKIHDFPNHIGKSKADKVAFSEYKWQRWFIPPGWIAEAKTQKREVANGGRRGVSSD